MDYSIVTQKGVKSYKDALTNIGWFDLPQNDEVKITARLEELSSAPDFFMHALVHLDFDSEIMDLQEDYLSILTQIEQFSNLNIVSKSVEFVNEETLRISFSTDKNSYSYDIDAEENGSWIDSDFIDDFLQDVFEDEGCESELFTLPGVDQTIQYIFVPETLYNKAIEVGVISDDMYLFTDY